MNNRTDNASDLPLLFMRAAEARRIGSTRAPVPASVVHEVP
jgi:hypothetical protein